MVQAQYFDARDRLHHRFHDRPRRLDQMGANLLEQISASFGREHFDQLLLGIGQDALKADQHTVANQVRMNVLRPAAHVLLLEARDPITNGGFDFSLGFHRAGNSYTVAKISSTFPKSPGLT